MEEQQFVAALRAGDEQAFVTLLERYYTPMLRIAMMYVPNRSVAEEVVQETWLGVLQGIHRFEERSSLKTWLFRILTNRAKTRGEREQRSIAFSSLLPDDTDPDEPVVDPAWFRPTGQEYAGWWVSYPSSWNDLPEGRLLAQETRAQLEASIAALPSTQRTVIALRDIEGWSSEEVCRILDITEVNQRVLLHRARSKVRRDLEQYFAEA
jgi:RNA polymerase sigma-70 factor (ECF subfamily)